MITKRLYLVSAILARVPSILYAAIYLLSIPVFALVYQWMPFSFYHGTIQHERSLDADADVILRMLRESIVRQSSATTEASQMRPDSSSLDLRRLKWTEGTFEASGSLFTSGDKPIFTSFSFTFPARQTTAMHDPKTDKWTYDRIVIVTFPPLSLDFESLFPPPEALHAAKMLWLHCGTELNNRLAAFDAARRGFPSKISSNYGRMLYLSVVTITTLGYGDIVPITSLARFFTGIEALGGIVLIGLFLNSLAYESPEKRNTD
jgi:hypothetical protein